MSNALEIESLSLQFRFETSPQRLWALVSRTILLGNPYRVRFRFRPQSRHCSHWDKAPRQDRGILLQVLFALRGGVPKPMGDVSWT